MAIEYDFESSVGYWVTITAMSFRRALNEELAPLGITFRQFEVLGLLVIHGQLSQSELASRMDIEAPTLAGIIDRMEASGWVTRIICTTDRRKKIVAMQAAAEPVWEQLVTCVRRVRAAATAGLSEEQGSQLRSMLAIVHGNLSKQSAGNREGKATIEAAPGSILAGEQAQAELTQRTGERGAHEVG